MIQRIRLHLCIGMIQTSNKLSQWSGIGRTILIKGGEMDIVKFIAVAVILIGLFAIRVIRYRSKWRKGGGSHGE
jgi:hypothetical protein